MGKSPKGTVSLVNSNGRLQARFRWQGKRYYLSLGLADTPKNRRLVAGRIAQIQRDLDYGEFTGDLSKYQPQAAGVVVTPKVPSLRELWNQYTEFRRPSLSPNTLNKVYQPVAVDLERCPHGLDNPAGLRDWLVQNRPPDFAKRIMTRINACCRWAVQSGLIPSRAWRPASPSPKVNGAAMRLIPSPLMNGRLLSPGLKTRSITGTMPRWCSFSF